jgi:hypothetical protein
MRLPISVVLMDELDQLLTAKQDVVYNFFNWPTLRDSQLFVIAVANRMDLPQQLAAKVKSRLGKHHLTGLLHVDANPCPALRNRHAKSVLSALRSRRPHGDCAVKTCGTSP